MLLADSTLTDSIPQSAKKDKPHSGKCNKLCAMHLQSFAICGILKMQNLRKEGLYMANKVNLTLRIEPELRDQASELFQALGLDLSTATGLFYRQALRCNGLPFEVKLDGPVQPAQQPETPPEAEAEAAGAGLGEVEVDLEEVPAQ